jgi:glycosyltransferase involved in cell wall biosynthesis
MTGVDISAIIPCRNEKAHIESCVRSLLAQIPTEGGFEIIVSDGMSEDGTRAILKRFAEQDTRLRIVDNPGKITPCGMNEGIRAARGRYIAIMGAHNRYAPDYLRKSIEVLEETRADNVGGAMHCEGFSYLQRAIAAAHHSSYSVGGARWHNPSYEGPADTVFGGVYRREVFDRIGLFDEELVRNQDDELNLRLTRSGGKIWQSPRIRSWYHPRKSLGALFRQYLQYGYWKVRVIQKHRLPASVRHVVPGFFLIALIALSVASLAWTPAYWLLFALGGVYLGFIGIGAATTAARRGWSLFPAFFPVFACYHFGYGLGFLKGIADFVLFRRHPSKRMFLINRR